MNKIIYALDFDGVVCDSAIETAITGWKTAGKLWQDMPEAIPQEKIDQFRLVRPMIETGYEAILAMRLLFLGESVDDICRHYNEKIQALIQEKQVSINDLKKMFGEARDHWIANDLPDWVNKNPLFAGVKDKLQKIAQENLWYVITTKHERFVKLILNANSIDLPEERIFGLERNMSKVEVLKQLISLYPAETIYFYEDRLPTLINVSKHDELADVNLVFVTWGYNNDIDEITAKESNFTVQELNEFLV